MRLGAGSPSEAALVVVGLAAAAGIAYAVDRAGGQIHACHQKQHDQLRVVSAGTQCENSELALDWSRSGVPGPTGPFTAFAGGQRRRDDHQDARRNRRLRVR